MQVQGGHSHPILKYVREDYYPYVVLPEPIALHLRGPDLPPPPPDPEPPQMPERPREPELPTMPKRPVRPNLPDLPQPLMSKLQSAVATGAGVAVLVGLIAAEAPAFLVALGIGSVTTLASFLYESWTYEKRRAKYEREKAERIREHEEALRRWEAECEAIKRRHRNEVARLSFRRQGVLPNTFSNAQPGRFDNFLRDVLRKKINSLEKDGFEVTLFPENAAISIRVQGRNGYYHKDYTPDIAMQVSRNRQSLLVDIEIDEPWFLENGWRFPIHTIDDGRQKKRDTRLADKGWVVIRFSERQVAKESEECINFIFYLILSAFAPDPEQLNLSFPFPTDHKRWDSQSAFSEPRFPLPYSRIFSDGQWTI
jgi:hypothetical protein